MPPALAGGCNVILIYMALAKFLFWAKANLVCSYYNYIQLKLDVIQKSFAGSLSLTKQRIKLCASPTLRD
ncbi:hypothetical protein C4F50_21485 [Flavobacterium sp. KB82]|uniref:Secreted protein n=1 Tax=Flavobacterium hungaricum TaxID=2082725 RepID=A0ABR9TQ49_9FLAO|nr:hypothetical protein [Flavobacterium hungaricum]